MASTLSTTVQRKAAGRITQLIGQTLEEEIFTINSAAPALIPRLPSLFSESVVDSITEILGDSAGEALLRSIGDENLHDPDCVYDALDEVCKDGGEFLKAAVREEFRVKVHKLYKLTLDMAPPTPDFP